jgi:pimeloyl-ACP methyl ester carboxylesterase
MSIATFRSYALSSGCGAYPGEFPLQYAERFVSVPDGLHLFVRDYAAVGAPRNVPVVCIHGLTRNSADFEDIAPVVAAMGRRVLAVDVRGRGKSGWDPDPTRYRPDVYTGDVVHVMDSLKIDHAAFIGTSMGGLIAMLLSAVVPKRVAAAVLNDIGPVVNPSGLARIAGYVGKVTSFDSWDAVIAAIRATNGVAFPDADDAFWRTMARRVARAREDGKIVFNYDPAIARAFDQPPGTSPPNLKPFFETLREKPVLVVRGALSDLLAPEGVEAMRQIKPDIDYAEVPRVGHAPMLDEPVAREALERFLGRLA